MAGYPPLNFTAGTGGGCVTSGPFKTYTVNMGPSTLSMPGGNVSSMSNPLDYNPRCLKRSLTTSVLRSYANYTAILELILQHHDIWDFETAMQGIPGSGLGVHGSGHYAMGGDPGRDMDVSPADPAFWHHHGMIDRVWWIWQHLDLEKRQLAISGTGTFMNHPSSPNTTLDTMVDLGLAVRRAPAAMRDLMSTTAGPFCYVYL
jgi:tyrosinase